MGQTTRSQGISFTHEKWTRIEARCKDLKVGRSQYFQMLAEWDLHFMTDIHAHKADGKWHFYPEHGSASLPARELKAAEDPDPTPAKPTRRRH